MAAPHISLTTAKAVARATAIKRRDECDPALGAMLARHVLAGLHIPSTAIVAGFWPMGREIDIRPLLRALHARGHMIALPETPPRGQALIFRHWEPGMAMIAERFGTHRPSGPIITPDLILAPLLAFDRAGRRLGYGGGYYDRTLAALPHATAIGCGYACQELDEVPADAYDARLSAIATEAGVITIASPLTSESH